MVIAVQPREIPSPVPVERWFQLLLPAHLGLHQPGKPSVAVGEQIKAQQFGMKPGGLPDHLFGLRPLPFRPLAGDGCVLCEAGADEIRQVRSGRSTVRAEGDVPLASPSRLHDSQVRAEAVMPVEKQRNSQGRR